LSQTAASRDGSMVYFDFTCEGCGAEGRLGIPSEHRDPVGCLEDCGATYILWKDGAGYKLTCVVCSVYEES
jgi:hypothetical protein